MVKLGEISRTATFAWSHHNTTLVSATVAGAVDADFSSTAQLEIWDLVDTSNSELKLVTQIDTDARFYSVAWSKPSEEFKSGVIAGALESGSLVFYDAAKLIDGSVKTPIKTASHSSAVLKVEFNPVQPALLVSVSSTELFIWDLKNLKADPLSIPLPNNLSDVTTAAWNSELAYILAIGDSRGNISMFNLKAKREAVRLVYPGNRPVSALSWHPNNTKKLIIATSADTSAQDTSVSSILLWDLQNAHGPERVFACHHGILSLDWCKQDSSLLLSSGKNAQTFLWSTDQGDVIAEYPVAANWGFETKFHPSLPDLFATSSFDAKIVIQSLQDTNSEQTVQKSVSADDFWSAGASGASSSGQAKILRPFVPKWLGRPVSAQFGFGGKIAWVATATTAEGRVSTVHISKLAGVESEETKKLSEALKSNDLSQLFEGKKDNFDWQLLKKIYAKDDISSYYIDVDAAETTDGAEPAVEDDDDAFFSGSAAVSGPFELYSGDESDKTITKAVLSGNIEKAVDVCLKDGRFSDAFLLSINSSEALRTKVRTAYVSKHADKKPFVRVLAAVGSGNLSDLAENASVDNWKDIMASLKTHIKNPVEYNKLCVTIGDRLLEKSANDTELRDSALVCYTSGQSLDKASAIWLKELPAKEQELLVTADSPYSAHVKTLQYFIEKVSIFRSAIPSASSTSDQLNEVYHEYANVVAANGQLDLAQQFLNLLPKEYPGVSLERERVSKAVKKPAASSAATTTKVAPRSSKYVVPGANLVSAPTANTAPPHPAFGSAPGVPLTASSATAPNPYAAPAASVTTPFSNPYTPAAPIASANPYASASIKPAHNGSGVLSPPPMVGQPASGAPPPPPKKDPGGWNDLPTSALASSGPRSRPSSALPKVVAPFNAPAVNSPPVLSPVNQFGRPPSTQPTIPPPPTAGSRSASLSSQATPVVAAAPPPPANPYAPPPLSAEPAVNKFVPPPTGVASGITPPARSAIVSPPPNPYAPKFAQGGPGSPAPTNPYAPPPPQSPARTDANSSYVAPPPTAGSAGTRPPPASGAFVPPPIANGIIPTAPAQQFIGVPPTSGTQTPVSSAIAPSAAQPATPEPAPAPKYPPGDRSHIPAEAYPIFEVLSAELEAVKPLVPVSYKKQVADAERRINILFDHLNNEEVVSADTVADLVQLVTALRARDFATAQGIREAIHTQRSEECGQWVVGVRRLIDILAAVSAQSQQL